MRQFQPNPWKTGLYEVEDEFRRAFFRPEAQANRDPDAQLGRRRVTEVTKQTLSPLRVHARLRVTRIYLRCVTSVTLQSNFVQCDRLSASRRDVRQFQPPGAEHSNT